MTIYFTVPSSSWSLPSQHNWRAWSSHELRGKLTRYLKLRKTYTFYIMFTCIINTTFADSGCCWRTTEKAVQQTRIHVRSDPQSQSLDSAGLEDLSNRKGNAHSKDWQRRWYQPTIWNHFKVRTFLNKSWLITPHSYGECYVPNCSYIQSLNESAYKALEVEAFDTELVEKLAWNPLAIYRTFCRFENFIKPWITGEIQEPRGSSRRKL